MWVANGWREYKMVVDRGGWRGQPHQEEKRRVKMDRLTPERSISDSPSDDQMDIDQSSTPTNGAVVDQTSIITQPPSGSVTRDAEQARLELAAEEGSNYDPDDDVSVSAVDCICGNPYPWQNPPFLFTIECDSCPRIQHPTCMGFGDTAKPFRGSYYCHVCWPQRHAETVAALAKNEKIWEARKWREENTKPERQFPGSGPVKKFIGPGFGK